MCLTGPLVDSVSTPAGSCAARHAAVDYEFRTRHITPSLATSCGSIGVLRPVDAGTFVQIGVSMTPGCTVLTRLFSGDASRVGLFDDPLYLVDPDSV